MGKTTSAKAIFFVDYDKCSAHVHRKDLRFLDGNN